MRGIVQNHGCSSGACGWPHDTADYWSAPVAESHIVVVLIPTIRTTAFACRYKNKPCVIDLKNVPSRARVPAAKPRYLGSPVMLFVLVAIVAWAFRKPIGFTLVVIGQLTQIPLRRAAPFGLRTKQP